MIRRTFLLVAAGTLALSIGITPAEARDQWSKAEANRWYAGQRWPVGSNYTPATAINELEMWQATTFDPATIDKELGWAEQLHMTTMRVQLGLCRRQDADAAAVGQLEEAPYLRRAHRLFSEVLRADGTPYRPAETDLIRRLSTAPKGVVPPSPR